MVLDIRKPAIAYLIGLLQTDGSHAGSVDGKGKVTLELAVKDIATLESLRAHLPCYSSLTIRTRDTNFASAYTSAVLAFFNQEVRRDLAELGVPPGRKSDLVSPPLAHVYPRDAYLRGLLDGDGSVGWTARQRPYVSIVTASEPLARYVEAEILRITGVRRHTNRNARDGVFNVMVQNSPAARLAAYCWGGDPEVSIQRKRSVAAEVANWAPPAGSGGRFGTVKKPWTDEQDLIVVQNTVADAAELLDRSLASVSVRRWRLQKVARPQADEGDVSHFSNAMPTMSAAQPSCMGDTAHPTDPGP